MIFNKKIPNPLYNMTVAVAELAVWEFYVKLAKVEGGKRVP